MVDHSLGRVLDLFGLDLDIVRRWNGVVKNGVSA